MLVQTISAIAAALLVYKYCKDKPGPKANRFIISGFCGVAVFILGAALFNQGDKAQQGEAAIVAAEPAPVKKSVVKKEVLQLVEWQKLYQELENFKTDAVFLEYGFGANGQRSQQVWLETVNSHLLPLDVEPSYHATPSNLRRLAMAYVRNDQAEASRLKRELEKVFNHANSINH